MSPSPNLDLDTYRSWLRPAEDGKTAFHLGCRLTAAGLRIFAEDCLQMADKLDKFEEPDEPAES